MLAKRMEFLTRKSILWASFLATLTLTLIFGIVMQVWDFEVIDEMYVAEEILAHIHAMTHERRMVHFWLTATVDVLYPFVYGGFFIGVALKGFARAGFFLAIPSMLVIPVDLIEGFAQVMLLLGNDGYIHMKVIATPAKLALFFTGLTITAIGLVSIYNATRTASTRVSETKSRLQ